MKFKFYFCLALILVALFLLVMLLLDSMGKETPLLGLSEAASGLFDKISPGNWVSEDDIRIYSDRVVIYVKNTSLARYAATKSMDPVLDSTANGIEIPFESVEQIHVGDIITFKQGQDLVVHRIIKVGSDEEGWYCITKGDNAMQDDGKIRADDIKFITIAIIY